MLSEALQSTVKKGDGQSSLTFVSTQTLEKVGEVPVDGASIVGLLWHTKLNQLVLGNADGGDAPRLCADDVHRLAALARRSLACSRLSTSS